MKKFLILITLTLLLVSATVHSQQERCGMNSYMEALKKNPELLRLYNANQARFEAMKNNKTYRFSNTVMTPIVIPVAVHFPTADESDRACLEALAQTQIDVMNADYSATNTDLSNWNNASQFFPNTSIGSLDISFCLATQNHPTDLIGNPVEPDISDGDPAVTIGYNFANGSSFPEIDSNWAGYFNILVKNLNGPAGYSPLGGVISAGMTVCMDPNYFGAGTTCPNSGIYGDTPGYDKGRVLVHESGHFFNLNHSFSTSCATDDDGITDTPNHIGPIYGCTTPGTEPGCNISEYALTMNYMGYNWEDCMYMFTNGQTNVMQAYLNSLQSDFKPNTTTCNSTTPEFYLSDASTTTESCGNAIDLQVAYSTTNGFNETVAINVSCSDQNFQSSGASINSDTSTITSDGIINIGITNLSGLALGSYNIDVTASSISFTKDLTITLLISDGVCASEGSMQYATSITGVEFNTISNLNSGKITPYTDYTALSTDVNIGDIYDLTVNINTDGNYQVVTKVWIDWDQDCNFDESTEEYDLGMIGNVTNDPSGNSPLSINIPADAVLGTTTMRVSAKYTDPGSNEYSTACLSGFDGEVEDYSVNVVDLLNIQDFEINDWTVYPNPAMNLINIKYSNNHRPTTYIIYNMLGQKISRNNISNSGNSQSIDISGLDKGMYFVKLQKEGQSVSIPFVKK